MTTGKLILYMNNRSTVMRIGCRPHAFISVRQKCLFIIITYLLKCLLRNVKNAAAQKHSTYKQIPELQNYLSESGPAFIFLLTSATWSLKVAREAITLIQTLQKHGKILQTTSVMLLLSPLPGPRITWDKPHIFSAQYACRVRPWTVCVCVRVLLRGPQTNKDMCVYVCICVGYDWWLECRPRVCSLVI